MRHSAKACTSVMLYDVFFLLCTDSVTSVRVVDFGFYTEINSETFHKNIRVGFSINITRMAVPNFLQQTTEYLP